MAKGLTRIIVVVACVTALLATGMGTASASSTSQLDFLTEIDTANDGMNSTAIEWSGATYNADTHVLLTLDDEHNAYELTLDVDGAVDRSIPARLIELDLGTDDFEGVAWISGEQYAFLSEGSGEVIIATIPDAASNGTTTIDTSDIERSFPVISGNWGNLGPEGLATDGSAFYVAREMPATLTKFDWTGNFVASVSLTNLADASGVGVLIDGTYIVASHESRKVAHYAIDWDAETVTELATRNAGLFDQLEGVAVSGNSDVYLFGEDNTRKGRPGQTYSHLNGQIIAVEYAVSDLNCSGTVTIADAIIITKIETGLMTATPGCGSGDHNGDGQVSIVDAVMIAQCNVGLANVGCPDPLL